MIRMTGNKWIRAGLVLVASATLAAGAYVADKLISRPDRIEFERRRVALVYARDALLRYEYREGRLPDSLDDLIPAYITRFHLYEEGTPRYRYGREARRIEMAAPFRIRGLLPRQRAPEGFVLPEPEPHFMVAAVAQTAAAEPAPDSPAPEPMEPPTPAVPLADARVPDPPDLPTPAEPAPDPVDADRPLETNGSLLPQDTETVLPSAVDEPEPEPVAPVPEPEPTEEILADGLTADGEAPAAFWREPKGPEPVEPPEGVLVFEAQHWSEMNWAWEIREDPKSGGGAHIECKDERTNGGAQSHWTTFDFYGIRERHEISVLKYHFRVEQGGFYWLFGRMWPTDTHCSNTINVGVNRGGLHDRRDVKLYDGEFMGTRVPFRWRWARARRPFRLRAGDNYVHVFPHESGLMVDQFMLVPQNQIGKFRPNNEVYRANLAIQRGTAFERQAGPPLHLSFDTPSKVISAEHIPNIRLAMRSLRPAEGEARMRVLLREAAADRQDLVLADVPLSLDELPPLALADLDFSGLDFDALPRREYLLTAELTRDGQTLAEGHRVLMHPFQWATTDALSYLTNNQPGPLDGDKEPPAGDDALAWRPLKSRGWDPLGILDFGIQIAGGSLHAPAHRVIYAQTEVHVPETGRYLLKIQSDDQMLLWIDGKLAHRSDIMRSVIRNSSKTVLRLEQGARRIRIRVNQGKDIPKLEGSFWKASLRFRTPDDMPAHVTGR